MTEDKKGWVSIHRKIWDWPYSQDAEYLSVWIYLLTHATHTPYDSIFNGSRIKLQKGQLITGRLEISRKTKVSSSKVQRILKKLEIEQQIEQQTGNKNRLISILNWGHYQKSEQQSEQQLNNNWTTTEQQLNTYNNNNNKIIKQASRVGEADFLEKSKERFGGNTNSERAVKIMERATEDLNDFLDHASPDVKHGGVFKQLLDEGYKSDQIGCAIEGLRDRFESKGAKEKIRNWGYIKTAVMGGAFYGE